MVADTPAAPACNETVTANWCPHMDKVYSNTRSAAYEFPVEEALEVQGNHPERCHDVVSDTHHRCCYCISHPAWMHCFLHFHFHCLSCFLCGCYLHSSHSGMTFCCCLRGGRSTPSNCRGTDTPSKSSSHMSPSRGLRNRRRQSSIYSK